MYCWPCFLTFLAVNAEMVPNLYCILGSKQVQTTEIETNDNKVIETVEDHPKTEWYENREIWKPSNEHVAKLVIFITTKQAFQVNFICQDDEEILQCYISQPHIAKTIGPWFSVIWQLSSC